MKKLLVSLVVAFLFCGCSVISPEYTFKISGTSGSYSVTFSDYGGTSQFDCGNKEFKRSAISNDTYVLSAQNNNSTGTVTVSCYVGSELLKTVTSSAPYGIASISGTW
ncbi:MAG: hypothetical protein PHR83_05715 [Paludibacter sp.]|nr:hypothetical protein [Paludibacter sp.]